MNTGGLLEIDPLELKFPFELKKQISCSIQLSNKTDRHIAFKVKMTSPKKYCVRPNTGPESYCLDPQAMSSREAPTDMQCKDKFLVQSVITSDGTSAKDITPEMECAAAFVFYKTRYAVVIASRILQSSNPMLWAIDLAPEPHDVYWSNLWVQFDLLWFRRIAVQIATLAFMCVLIGPVTFVQGLSHLDKLQ